MRSSACSNVCTKWRTSDKSMLNPPDMKPPGSSLRRRGQHTDTASATESGKLSTEGSRTAVRDSRRVVQTGNRSRNSIGSPFASADTEQREAQAAGLCGLDGIPRVVAVEAEPQAACIAVAGRRRDPEEPT